MTKSGSKPTSIPRLFTPLPVYDPERTLAASSCSNSTMNQSISAVAAVLFRSSVSCVADRAIVTEPTPMMSSATYGDRPRFCPAPDWTEPNAIDCETSRCGAIGTLTWAAAAAKVLLPRTTVDLSFNSIACQKISVMSSGVPETLRSIVIVVESVSCARSILEPMSTPVPVDLEPDQNEGLVLVDRRAQGGRDRCGRAQHRGGALLHVDVGGVGELDDLPRDDVQGSGERAPELHGRRAGDFPEDRFVVAEFATGSVRRLGPEHECLVDRREGERKRHVLGERVLCGLAPLDPDSGDERHHVPLDVDRGGGPFVRHTLELDGRARVCAGDRHAAAQQRRDRPVPGMAGLEDQERLRGIDAGDVDDLDAIGGVGHRSGLNLLRHGGERGPGDEPQACKAEGHRGQPGNDAHDAMSHFHSGIGGAP